MNEEMVIQIGGDAIRTILILSGPMLFAAMAVGILVSILQAVTQINEATLTFIPKMIAIVVVLAVMAPWMLDVLTHYTQEILEGAGEVVR